MNRKSWLIAGLLVMAVLAAACPVFYTAGEPTVIVTPLTLDLSRYIDVPKAGSVPQSTFRRITTSIVGMGEYTASAITWNDMFWGGTISAPNTFEIYHRYSASFTLTAGASRTFEGLTDEDWNPEDGGANHFYHTGAESVQHRNNLGSTIEIIIIFPMILTQ